MNNEIEIIRGYKILYVEDTHLIASKGYRLYMYDFKSKKWEKYARVNDKLNSLLARMPLSERFFRAEITKIYMLNDNSKICIARKGLFKKNSDSKYFEKVLCIPRGTRPMNLCIDENYIYFGEYFANMDKSEVNIYVSKDYGESWNIAYTFKSGEINHIHGLFKDPYTGNIWFVTGDRENECIIGYTDNHFKTTKEIFRGGQEYRACILLFYKSHIAFATDSQYIKNTIKVFTRNSLKLEIVNYVQSSVIRGGQLGNFSYLSTATELSDINTEKLSHLWVSYDGLAWRDAFAQKKDCMPPIFQFATFEFPVYNLQSNMCNLYFYGRGLCKMNRVSFKYKI